MYEFDRFLQSEFAKQFLWVWHKARCRQSPVLLAIAFFRLICQSNHSCLFCGPQLAIGRIHRNIEFLSNVFGSDRLSCFVRDRRDKPPRCLSYTCAETEAFNEYLIEDQSCDCKIRKINFQVAIAVVAISLERPN